MYYRRLYYITVYEGDRIHMCKKRIKFAVTLITCITILYLQWGREADVRSSTALAAGNYQEEHVNFVLNRLFVMDVEKCAEELVEKCRKNDFQSIQFSYDYRKPNALYGTVYRSDYALKTQNPLFQFQYIAPKNRSGRYNMIDHPEIFVLQICDY